MSTDERPPGSEPKQSTFGQTARAVAWSFFGVRKRADLDRDIARLNPVHVLIGGVLGATVFVIALVLIVKWVVGSGVAA